MRGKTLVAILLAGIVGAILGAFTSGELAIVVAGVASLTGLAIAFVLNWVFIAPRAGENAKQRIINMVAEPGPDDEALLANLSAHIIGNMGALARHAEGRELFYPLFDIALDRIDERWKAITMNIASQRERGVGNFNPSNLQDADIMKDLKQQLIGGFADPLLDALGFEGERRKVAQAVFLSKFASIGGGNSGQGVQGSTPSYIQQ